MTDNSTHCYGGIWLKSDGNPVRLKAKLAGADDSIVKFEFDRSIPSDVTPKDVLEALGAVEVEGDIADITVRGHRLQCKYVDPKSVILNLGESPERSLDVTDRFLGVVYVSPSLGKTTSASKYSIAWQQEPSYTKFHKARPYGCDESAIPGHTR
ncbi:hypothetical protein BBOV_II005110 [Babesia bovis T2Bo]|uniref:hypothetical protein n=1 Tax=Babesia bovis T2Bo TaxID=484906 RepID=UPI001C350443|nr:hypothetical protein BBOV_II005110 [Babesia bovis T2Bo]EDO06463.2 hypothetical protein BBOV_II005110 [Babesia bovis T2Bo]